MREPFKDRLKKAMDIRRIKAVDICNSLHFSKASLSCYMSGKQEPKADRLHEMAKLLDVSEAWLIGYDVPMERDEEQKSNDEFEAALRRIEKDREFRQIIVKMNRLNPGQMNVIVSMLEQFRTE